MRRFWKGEGGAGAFATRLAGSSDVFEPAGKLPSRSINYLASHDGFTLGDAVRFAAKRNEANGEGGRDGNAHEVSWVAADPDADIRAMLATLFLSRGLPMLTAGDEFGRSQRGNNNAYAQDNAVTWLDWANADPELIRFVAELAQFRRSRSSFFADRFLAAAEAQWLEADGTAIAGERWNAAGHAGIRIGRRRRCDLVQPRRSRGRSEASERALVAGAGERQRYLGSSQSARARSPLGRRARAEGARRGQGARGCGRGGARGGRRHSARLAGLDRRLAHRRARYPAGAARGAGIFARLRRRRGRGQACSRDHNGRARRSCCRPLSSAGLRHRRPARVRPRLPSLCAAARSDAGIGDFETLARFAETAARLGGALVGINPLHHLFPDDRGRASPYQPSDRRFLDPIYIDLEGLAAEFAGTGLSGLLAARRSTLAELRALKYVDYAGRLAPQAGGAGDAPSPCSSARLSPRSRAFIAEGGEALRRHGEFESRRGRRLTALSQWLQWVADRQLAAAAKRAKDAGLEVGPLPRSGARLRL